MRDPEAVFRDTGPLTGCESTLTTLQPADCLDFDPPEWAGAVLVVMSGRLRIECRTGRGASFPAGAVLFLGGLDLRQITNPGLEPLVLKTIRRLPKA